MTWLRAIQDLGINSAGLAVTIYCNIYWNLCCAKMHKHVCCHQFPFPCTPVINAKHTHLVGFAPSNHCRQFNSRLSTRYIYCHGRCLRCCYHCLPVSDVVCNSHYHCDSRRKITSSICIQTLQLLSAFSSIHQWV
jgi:hypothetical protein